MRIASRTAKLVKTKLLGNQEILEKYKIDETYPSAHSLFKKLHFCNSS